MKKQGEFLAATLKIYFAILVKKLFNVSGSGTFTFQIYHFTFYISIKKPLSEWKGAFFQFSKHL